VVLLLWCSVKYGVLWCVVYVFANNDVYIVLWCSVKYGVLWCVVYVFVNNDVNNGVYLHVQNILYTKCKMHYFVL
jgi:predicted 3-demethylubiquinone-9 3-methyltransferase (glyoxalase superfamily)